MQYSQQQYRPQYGADSVHGHPLTTQPRSAGAESQYVGGAPPPGELPKVIVMHPEEKSKSSNGNGAVINNNTNNNNNTSNSNSAVVVNANVTAGAGLGSGNRLLLVGKDMLMSRLWNSNLYDCCNDVVGCTWTMLCLPLAYIKIANRLNECACVTCCVPGGFAALRTKLRTMGGIRGSIFSDCAATTCCCFCVACQMQREMNDMKL